jgi:hypothetical protein
VACVPNVAAHSLQDGLGLVQTLWLLRIEDDGFDDRKTSAGGQAKLQNVRGRRRAAESGERVLGRVVVKLGYFSSTYSAAERAVRAAIQEYSDTRGIRPEGRQA